MCAFASSQCLATRACAHTDKQTTDNRRKNREGTRALGNEGIPGESPALVQDKEDDPLSPLLPSVLKQDEDNCLESYTAKFDFIAYDPDHNKW